jgi:type III secretion system FlhB-like substrate exporter
MMLAVSYADVIIVSQLRSAIALRYDATKHDTPIIVAKGVASVALQIKKIFAFFANDDKRNILDVIDDIGIQAKEVSDQYSVALKVKSYVIPSTLKDWSCAAVCFILEKK